MKKYLNLSALFVIALALVACGGSSNAESTPLPTVPADYAGKSSPGDAGAGMEVFNNNCQTCHGPGGLGDGPAGSALDPKPANLPALASQVKDDYFFWRINTGVPGTSMVAWNSVLSEQEIWDVIAYIRTLK